MVYILSEEERPEREAQNDFDELFIPAESFSNSSGVFVQAGTDEDDGQIVTNIEDGTWLSYSHINIPETGNYIVEYRVASLNGGLLQIEEGGNPDNAYGNIQIPPTGGHAEWVTVSHELTLQNGIQNFGLKALEGGWNFNWFRFIPEPSTFLSSLWRRDFKIETIIANGQNEEISFFANAPSPERAMVLVYSIEGQVVVGPKWIEISIGRHVIRSGKALLPGVYLLSLNFERDGILAEKFIVK
ncbi:carbohydrate-binding protein [Geofilum rubicundum]|uniref:Putative secreted glycosyl hydrolase n=1 Tax=Geofilum rubicundum JCM 15548 TaxID=1236989 RepID=A0A0E9LWT2_9BACT|nr:carbohydrate-binding protein [Geofilum rubicundum]GAO29581.1 putative secreted glycosyl hydrolase [Geofilum rubicundum JCM 15548]